MWQFYDALDKNLSQVTKSGGAPTAAAGDALRLSVVEVLADGSTRSLPSKASVTWSGLPTVVAVAWPEIESVISLVRIQALPRRAVCVTGRVAASSGGQFRVDHDQRGCLPGVADPQGEHELIGVVTQPDKPVGREQRIEPPPIKAALGASNVPVLQPKRIKAEEAITEIRALAPDVIVVMAYGQILPRAILEIPRIACVNLHASLLPRHRGADHELLQRATCGCPPVR